MKKFWKKSLLGGIFLGLALITLAGCGKSSSLKTIKLGVTGSDLRLWNPVKKNLKKEGINLQIVSFQDYSQPNTELQSKQININAFQTQSFLDAWNKAHKSNIVSVGKTVIAPLALYSQKIKNVNQLKDGDQIAVPNDASNEARSLNLLQDAGLIKLDNKALPTTKDIIQNKKHLKIVPVDASQTPRSLNDVAASAVNSGVAQDSKLPDSQRIFAEKISKKTAPYVNIIAANGDDKNNKDIQKVVKAYQTEDTEKLIKKLYGDKEEAAWNLKFN